MLWFISNGLRQKRLRQKPNPFIYEPALFSEVLLSASLLSLPPTPANCLWVKMSELLPLQILKNPNVTAIAVSELVYCSLKGFCSFPTLII